jgi:hypothetical protein
VIENEDENDYLIPSYATSLGISARFKTEIGDNIASGDFGLKIILKTKKRGYQMDLESKDIFGNVYNLEDFLL